MKKNFLLLSAIFILSLTGCGSTDTSKEEISNLQSQYDLLESKYDKLNSEHTKLKTDHSDLEKKYKQLQSDYNELEQQQNSENNIVFDTPTDLSEYDTNITYEQLARTPDDYKGKAICMSGEVIQLLEGDDINALRIATDDSWNDVIYAEYNPSITNKRVLENDKVTFYGIYYGIDQYESTIGQTISIPVFYVDYIEINE